MQALQNWLENAAATPSANQAFERMSSKSMATLLSSCLIVILAMSFSIAPMAVAQEDPEAKPPPSEAKPEEIPAEEKPQEEPEEKKPQDERKLPVEVKMRQLSLKYETEISFLLPEGEFEATLQKKIGHFATLTRARYNFLRGEMGFSLQNAYTRFRFVPEMQVYDRLLFVPLFEPVRPDRIWRREQGIQLGTRIFFLQPLNVLTSFNYQRFSFPSIINQQELASQQVHSVGQSLGVQADSARFLGFHNSGWLDAGVVRAFPFGSNRSDFWQLQIITRGITEGAWLSISGELRVLALLEGHGVPVSFLGGRNRLSGYDTNEFSGINLVYLSESTRFHLNKKKPLSLVSGFSMHEINLVVHPEVGQIGFRAKVRNPDTYHVSIGIGFNSITAYRRNRAFELFFYVYKALEDHRKPRYYFGIKY